MEFNKMFETLKLLGLPNRNIFMFFSQAPEGFKYKDTYYEKQVVSGYLPKAPANAGPYYVFIVHIENNNNNVFAFGDRGFLTQSHYNITDKTACDLVISYMKALRDIMNYEDSNINNFGKTPR